MPSETTPEPEIVIQNTSAILHVGIPNGTMSVEEVRARKKDGRKLFWILTPEEMKTFEVQLDETTVRYISDGQLRHALHEQMYLWMGAELLPPGEKNQKVAQIMAQLAQLHEFNESSNKVLATDNLPTRNTFKNYRWVDDGVPIRRVRNVGKGKPCVIIAAGPSLNGQWAYLRAYREAHRDVPFIVCGRSYKKAMQEGVWPEFVMEVEQYDWDADLFMFAPQPPPHTVMAFPITTTPRIPHVWPGPKMCLPNHNIAQLMGMKLGEESVDGGNSVLHYMVTLAGIIASDTIYFAGVDFGYPKGVAEDTHATGTFHPWPQDVTNIEHTHQQGLELPANDGGTVMSSVPYSCFGTYLSVQIERLKQVNKEFKAYTFSHRGLKVDGVEYKDIDTWNTPPAS